MDYMTLKEASEKWGVTPRQINYLCTRRCKDGYHLADSQGCRETGRPSFQKYKKIILS